MINPQNEAYLQALYATHLFAHLVPLPAKSKQYIIDKNRFPKDLRKCPCDCGSVLNLGYTGFGKCIYLNT